MADPDATPMVVEEPAAVDATQPFVLPVLEIIRLSQGQNGIKHGDHLRYRRHCTHRLRSLFKVLHFQHGRTKYQKRKLDAHNITDVRHLHILLFSAERCWAYAMELKKAAVAKPDTAARKRHHLARRLAKAQVWATELARFAADKCDTRSALEAEGYSAWLAGNLLLEKESDWPTALAKFARAMHLFVELAKVGSSEQQAACTEMVNQIDPSLRYCNYQIQRQGGAATTDTSALVAMGDQEGRAGLELLQSKLAALAEESATQQVSSTSHTFEWYGQTYPVRDQRVRACLRQAQLIATQLAEDAEPAASAAESAAAAPVAAATTAGPSSSAAAASGAAAPTRGTLEHKLMLLDKLSNSLVEARSHVRNAAKASSANEGEGAADELSSLEVAISGAILQRAVERSAMMENDVRERFEAGLVRHAQGKRARDKTQYARPEDVVRCIDTLMRHLEDYANLGAQSGGRRGEQLHDTCTARIAVCQASRCYYVAHAYLAGGKPKEALALFSRTLERLSSAGERVAALLPAAAQEVGATTDLKALAKLATAYRTVAHAEFEAEAAKAADSAQAGVAGLALTQQQGAAADPSQPTFLITHLDCWESFAGNVPPAVGAAASGKAAAAAALPPAAAGAAAAAAPRLLPVPPPLTAVPVRPIMLDTASGHIVYPSLEHRIKKTEKKAAAGVLSSLFGGWGRTAS